MNKYTYYLWITGGWGEGEGKPTERKLPINILAQIRNSIDDIESKTSGETHSEPFNLTEEQLDAHLDQNPVYVAHKFFHYGKPVGELMVSRILRPQVIG